MKQPFKFRQSFVILLLLAVILSPRLLAGVNDQESAKRLVEAGDYASASSAYVSAVERLPWNGNLYGLTGQSFWLAGEPERALSWFRKGESLQALSMQDWLLYGDTLAALGDDHNAVQAWKNSILLFEPSFGAAWRLGAASRQEGDFSSTIKYLEQARELAPGDAGTHYLLGLLLVATAPEEALPELMQAVSLQPDMEATVQVLRTELNRAFLVDERAYQFTTSGRALASIGEWDLAEEAFRRATEENENYAEAWAWLGEARQQRGQDGQIQIEKALRLDPHSAGIQALYGLYWLRQGEPEKALTAYEKAAALEPENPIWQISLGDAASASGNLIAAVEHYYNAIALSPEDPSGWRSLALFCLDHDTDVKNTGLVAAQQLFQLAPDDWLTYEIAGRVGLALDRRLEAKTFLEKAIELAPEEPSPHFYMALIYLESRLYVLAYDKLVDTQMLDPDGDFGWQASRILEQYFP